jgi:hypothetical protein
MKNKGMHQQPNAFTPSTGGAAPKNVNKGGFQPAAHTPHQSTPQQSWNKPTQTPQAPTAPVANGGNKGFVKGGKKAA